MFCFIILRMNSILWNVGEAETKYPLRCFKLLSLALIFLIEIETIALAEDSEVKDASRGW